MFLFRPRQRCLLIILRCMSQASGTPKGLSLHNVAIIGGGLLGSGIAHEAASGGFHVTLIEKDENSLQTAFGKLSVLISGRLPDTASRSVEHANHIRQSLNRIHGTTQADLASAIKNADLIIESIHEHLSSKQEIFKKIDNLCKEDAIFATNTSTFHIRELATVTKRRDRFAGMHYIYPIHVRRVIEIVRTEDTSDKTIGILKQYTAHVGKTSVVCKDTSGFIINRLMVPFLAEAVRMYDRGDASAVDIDTAIKLGCGLPFGPLEYCDMIGLDSVLGVLEKWRIEFPGNPLFNPPQTLLRLVADKKLGRKTGQGFYTYDSRLVM